MNREKFFLVLMSIFAILFVIAFLNNRAMESSLAEYQKMIRAYELYTNGYYEDFFHYIEQNNLQNLTYLKSLKRNYSEFYIEGLKKCVSGDYEVAIDYFKESLEDVEISNPLYTEILYYLGLSMINAEKYQEAEITLERLLDFKDSIYAQKGLRLLIKLYTKTGNLDRAKEIEKLMEVE